MGKKGKILVLDDDHIVTISCKRILGAEGYDIVTVDRGREAIKKIGSEEFDLLISDIGLPDIDGLTVVKESRIIQPKLDVVIITGYPTLEDAKESVRLGVFEYVEKPFTPEFMINVAKKVFVKRGWILRQSFIDEFRNYVVPLRLKYEENPVIFYKEGTWVRPIMEGLWEVGCDVRYWLLATEILCIDISEGLSTFIAGKPFAKVTTSKGETHELIAPMTGVIKEINHQVNEDLSAFISENLGRGWLLWLARIQPPPSNY
ncbi:MAG: response regulator [Nitrospirae bacterium]|nr:response regulator [Nitrospirota bacterium]